MWLFKYTVPGMARQGLASCMSRPGAGATKVETQYPRTRGQLASDVVQNEHQRPSRGQRDPDDEAGHNGTGRECDQIRPSSVETFSLRERSSAFSSTVYTSASSIPSVNTRQTTLNRTLILSPTRLFARKHDRDRSQLGYLE